MGNFRRSATAGRPSAPAGRANPAPTAQGRLAGLLILGLLSVTAYLAWTYHTRLKQVTHPILQIAQLEADATAAGDLATFMALQDPDDPAWRQVQEERLGQLERVGLPKLGWAATSPGPELGLAVLEPGGARLDVTYHLHSSAD